jgi:hypothetical protein
MFTMKVEFKCKEMVGYRGRDCRIWIWSTKNVKDWNIQNGGIFEDGLFWTRIIFKVHF